MAHRSVQLQKGQDDRALGLQGHWLALDLQWIEEVLQVTVYDGLLRQPPAEIEAMLNTIAVATCSTLHLQVQTLIPQGGGHHHGTIALLHLLHLLGLPCQCTEVEAIRWYDTLRAQDTTQHRVDPSGRPVSSAEPWSLTGSGPHAHHDDLIKLLVSKGVPEDAAADRATEVINKLGGAIISHAFRSENAWSSLKQAANAPGSRIRLVTQWEQKQYVDKRAREKHGADAFPAKKKGKSSSDASKSSRLTLAPELLKIDAAHFRDEDDHPLGQIRIEDVIVNATGLALVTEYTARQYISNPQSISTGALGLLFVELPLYPGNLCLCVATPH